MKKPIKVVSTVFVFCYLSYNDTPRYDNKTVLDIRNKTNQSISGMYLSIVVPETYSVPDGDTYYDGNIVIPDIKPHERIIVVLDQKRLLSKE